MMMQEFFDELLHEHCRSFGLDSQGKVLLKFFLKYSG